MVFGCCCSSGDPSYAPVVGGKSRKYSKGLHVRNIHRDNHTTSISSSLQSTPPTTYLKKSGNALSATPFPPPPPENLPIPNSSHPVNPPTDLIAVIVPHGVYGGQTIRVQYPDGSGREVAAKVPIGMTAGSMFYVQAAPPTSSHIAPHNSPYSVDITPASILTPTTIVSPQFKSKRPLPPDPVPFSQYFDAVESLPPLNNSIIQPTHPKTATTSTGSHRSAESFHLRLLKVMVPPHTKPGSTIRVQVPGEDRVIAAQVPPNCVEFYVEYFESKNPFHHQRTAAPMQPFSRSMPSSSPPKHYIPQHQQHYTTKSSLPPPLQQRDDDINYTSRKEQSLLLVQVPPGVVAGTIMYVHVPGEPGRVLRVTVPSGNVRAFHVSYSPRR